MFANFARKFLVLFVSSLLLLGFGGKVAEKSVEKGVTVCGVTESGTEYEDEDAVCYVSNDFVFHF